MKLEDLDDSELVRRLKALTRQERERTADVVAHLAEMDRRGLAVEKGFPSLFVYCVRELGYNAPSAYHRIRAARAVRKQPALLTMLRSGEMHLEGVVLLHPHMDGEHAQDLLDKAKGKTSREIEGMIARFEPQQERPDSIKPLAWRPEGAAADPEPTLWAPPSEMAPKEVLRLHFSFTADEELESMVNRARDLLWHKYPNGRLEDIFRDALNVLLDKKDPDRRLKRLGLLPKPEVDNSHGL